MKDFYKYLSIIQALSIDVSLGGVIGAWFIATYLGIHLDFMVYLILGVSVWLIYAFDHLMDVRMMFDLPATYRHRIHWENSTNLWGIWSLALIIVLSLLYKLPPVMLVAGTILAFVVLLYFISLKLLEKIPVFHKELVGSIIYTTGIFIPPVSSYHGSIGPDLYILYFQFLMIALSNLLLFSMYDSKVDEQEGFHSLVITIGENKVRKITWISLGMVFLSGIAGILLLDTSLWSTQVILFLMDIVLLIILMNKSYFIVYSRFRIVGDSIFFLPLIYILFLYVV